MIPAQNILAWGAVIPGGDQRQVEQDLIIGRALVEMGRCWSRNSSILVLQSRNPTERAVGLG